MNTLLKYLKLRVIISQNILIPLYLESKLIKILIHFMPPTLKIFYLEVLKYKFYQIKNYKFDEKDGMNNLKLKKIPKTYLRNISKKYFALSKGYLGVIKG